MKSMFETKQKICFNLYLNRSKGSSKKRKKKKTTTNEIIFKSYIYNELDQTLTKCNMTYQITYDLT